MLKELNQWYVQFTTFCSIKNASFKGKILILVLFKNELHISSADTIGGNYQN